VVLDVAYITNSSGEPQCFQFWPGLGLNLNTVQIRRVGWSGVPLQMGHGYLRISLEALGLVVSVAKKHVSVVSNMIDQIAKVRSDM
jgi:hypothetical protein